MTKPKSQAARKPPAIPRTPAAAKPRSPKTTRSAPSAPLPPEPPAPTTKLAILTALLRREEGATVVQMTAATGWQAHSVRGALAGALAKKFGAKVSSRLEDGVRVYLAPKPAV